MRCLLTLLLLLTACLDPAPYRSFVPLGEPESAALDASLLGTWDLWSRGLPEHEVVVRRDGDRFYDIAVRMPGETGSDFRLLLLRGYITELDGARFLNLQMPGSLTIPPIEFAYLLRFELRGDELRGRGIMQSAGLDWQFTSSAELRNALRARLTDPSLYGDQHVWRRVAP